MRRVVLAIGVLASRAEAEPRLEASGFVGVGVFTSNTELGNSWAPEQVPRSAPIVGGRLGWLAVPALAQGEKYALQLAVEAELSIATAYTGDDGGRRASYFAPVFGWRTHAAFRLAGATAVPQLIAGVGGETVASTSPYMSKETDPVVYWGAALALPVSSRWLARVDVRHGIMAGRDDGVTSTIELQLGMVARFGLPERARRAEPEPPPPVQAKVDDVATRRAEIDTDGDGIPDRLDMCPTERETVNGVDDGDGCAEVDPDGDGIIGAADKCPDRAEDFDRFEDDDGCPEADNEGDGIDDVRDACPLEPETKNGFEDDDGCPDTIPDDITKMLTIGGKLGFEPNRARITNATRDALQPVLAMLSARPSLHITITGRPDVAKNADLAKRRAEAIKWFLVDAGVTGDRVATEVGEPGKPAIALTLTSH